MTLRLVLCGLVLTSCNTLPEIVTGQCGNGVLEGNESCDRGIPSQLQSRTELTCGDANLGEEFACRFTCNSSVQCPTGWRCKSESGTCLFASGQFDLVAGPVTPTARTQLDVLLDESEEVILVEADTVALDRRGALLQGGLSERVPLPGTGVIGDLSVGQLPGERPGRWVVPTLEGVVVSRVDETGATQSEPFSATDLLGENVVDEAKLFELPEPCAGSRIVTVALESNAVCVPDVNGATCSSLPAALGAGSGALVITATDIDGTPGDEIVVGRLGGRSVVVYRPQVIGVGDCVAGRITLRAAQTLNLQGASTRLGGRPMVADADGDGRADLFLPMAPGPVGVEAWQVALRQVGLLRFDDPILDRRTPTSMGCPVSLPPRDSLSERRLVAVRDLDGDGRADLVTSDGVALTDVPRVDVTSLSGTACLIAAPPPGFEYASVKIGDVNADGLVDLVETYEGDARILGVSVGSRTGLLSRTFYAVPDPVQAIALGDFDADGAQDAVILQTTGALGVWRGARTEIETREVMPVGRIEGALGLDTGRVTLADFEPDNRDDVLLLARGGAESFVLYGSPGAQLIAPLRPPLPDDPANAVLFARGPSAAAVGGFGELNGAVLSVYPDGSSLLVPFDPDLSRFDVARQRRLQWPTELQPGSDGQLTLRPLEGRRVVAFLSGGQMSRLGVVEIGGERPYCEITDVGQTASGGALTRLRRMETVDVNGDGLLDLLTVFNDDEGYIELRLSTSAAPCGLGPRQSIPRPSGLRLVDATILDVDRDPEFEVAMLTEDGVLLSDRERLVFAAPVRGSEGAIRAADIDGDGVDELIVSTGREMFVLGNQISSASLDIPGVMQP